MQLPRELVRSCQSAATLKVASVVWGTVPYPTRNGMDGEEWGERGERPEPGEEPRCWRRKDWIIAHAGVTERAYKDASAWLVEHGWVERRFVTLDHSDWILLALPTKYPPPEESLPPRVPARRRGRRASASEAAASEAAASEAAASEAAAPEAAAPEAAAPEAAAPEAAAPPPPAPAPPPETTAQGSTPCPNAQVVRTEVVKPDRIRVHRECSHCRGQWTHEESRHVCKAKDPWVKGKAAWVSCPDRERVKAEVVKPGRILVHYRCPHCRDEWTEEESEPAPAPKPQAPAPAKPLNCTPEEQRDLEYLMTVLADARAAVGMPAAPDAYQVNTVNAGMLLRRLRSLRLELGGDPVPLLSAVIVAKVVQQSQSGNPKHRVGDYATATAFFKDKGATWPRNRATGLEVLQLAEGDDRLNALLAAARALPKGPTAAPAVPTAQGGRQPWGGPASLDDDKLSLAEDEIPY